MVTVTQGPWQLSSYDAGLGGGGRDHTWLMVALSRKSSWTPESGSDGAGGGGASLERVAIEGLSEVTARVATRRPREASLHSEGAEVGIGAGGTGVQLG